MYFKGLGRYLFLLFHSMYSRGKDGERTTEKEKKSFSKIVLFFIFILAVSLSPRPASCYHRLEREHDECSHYKCPLADTGHSPFVMMVKVVHFITSISDRTVLVAGTNYRFTTCNTHYHSAPVTTENRSRFCWYFSMFCRRC